MSVPQRRVRPFSTEPGHWKLQLAGKHRAIAVKGDLPALRWLLREHPEFLNKRGSHGRTLLWEAVRSGRLATVKYLVAHGADINATGCYNSESHVQLSPYCAAVYYRRDEVAAYLKSLHPRNDIFRAAFLGDARGVRRRLDAKPELLNAEDEGDEIYYVPLVGFAVAGGHIDLTAELIDRGAWVEGYSVLLLYLVTKDSRMDMLELLIAHGADASAADCSVFVATDDLAILRYLLDHGTSASQLHTNNGQTPLIYVARGDKGEHVEKAQLLLQYGAQVNAATPDGRTALHYAATARHKDMVNLLLEYGADPNLEDNQGIAARNIINHQ